MRWPRPRDAEPHRLASPLDTIAPEEVAALETVELDAHGRLVGLPPWPDDDSLHEIGYGPSGRDGTGTAGIWDALAHF